VKSSRKFVCRSANHRFGFSSSILATNYLYISLTCFVGTIEHIAILEILHKKRSPIFCVNMNSLAGH
jgi:hypothetical protein